MRKEVKSERLVRRRKEISEMKRKERGDGVSGYHSTLAQNRFVAFNFMLFEISIFHLSIFKPRVHHSFSYSQFFIRPFNVLFFVCLRFHCFSFLLSLLVMRLNLTCCLHERGTAQADIRNTLLYMCSQSSLFHFFTVLSSSLSSFVGCSSSLSICF